MTGQRRKDPFHVNRDVVRDNLTVTRKVRLPRGAQIRAQCMFALADLTSIPTSPPSITNAAVNMPYTGTIKITVVEPSGGDVVTLANPFITGAATQPIVLNSSPDATATLSESDPGQVVLNLTGGVEGVYIISVGVQTDARNNNFSQ